MKIFQNIRKIDLFGRRVELRFDKHKKHKTYCGAVMTLFIFIITIIVVLIYVQQFTKYDNPFLRIYYLSQEQAIDINNSNDNYGAGLMLQIINKQNNKAIEQDSLVLVANLIESQENQSSITMSHKLEKCEDSDLYCLPKVNNMNITPFWEEGFDKEKRQYLEIQVYECNKWQQQSGKQMNCKPQTETINNIQNAQILFHFNQYEVNPKDYYNPISQIQRIHQHTLIDSSNIDQIEEIKLVFQQIIVSTDKGWILDSYQNQYLLSYNSVQDLKSIKKDNVIFSTKIYIHNQRYYMERSYSKIQVYLAYIGGIIKMLMMLGEFITRPFVRLSLSLKIINEVFDFEGGESIEGSSDLLSCEDEQFNDTKFPSETESPIIKIPLRNQGRSSYASQNKNSQSFSAFDGMNLSINKEKFPSTRGFSEQNDPAIQPGNLIKIQKTMSTHQTHQTANDGLRNRNISVIQEHQHDAHSVSTLQNYQKQGSLSYSPMLSKLAIKNQNQMLNSKLSEISIDFLNQNQSQHPSGTPIQQSNCAQLQQIQEAPFQDFTVNTEEASPKQIFQRNKEIKQTFQPINMTNSKDVNIIPQLNNTGNQITDQVKEKSQSTSSFSSSSSSSSQSQSQTIISSNISPKQKFKQFKQQKQYSSSLPSSPRKNSLIENKFFYPSYISHINGRKSQLYIQNMIQQSERSQKIISEIEQLIHTPPHQQRFLYFPQLLGQQQNENSNAENQLQINQNFIQTCQNNLSCEQNQLKNKQTMNYLQVQSNQLYPQQRNNKSILKNGNSLILRHSRSAGDGLGLEILNDIQTPLKKLNRSNQYEFRDKDQNSEEKPVILNKYQSDTQSLRYSPHQYLRQSLILLSPQRESISVSSPGQKCPTIKNLCLDTISQDSKLKDSDFFEKRQQALPKQKNRNFKIPNNIFVGIGQKSESQDRQIRSRNISQSRINMPRNSTKRFSIIDKQKILAVSKLMQNYQNHQETPLQALKDYGKLAQSPKKKIKNADSIFKRLFKQGKVLKMKFFDYITFYMQCFKNIYSEKKNQIKYSKSRVKERLDVVYIMQKLVEIDKLKMLVLNDYQIKLFEYLPKPIVHLDPKEIPESPGFKNKTKNILANQQPQNMQQAWSMLHQQKKPIEKATEASEVYRNMIDCEEKYLSQIDRKLLDMMDIRIKTIFGNISAQNKRLNQPERKIEINNQIFYTQQNINSSVYNGINPLDDTLVHDNQNETVAGFADTQQRNRLNLSNYIDKEQLQDRKSSEDLNKLKIEIKESINISNQIYKDTLYN